MLKNKLHNDGKNYAYIDKGGIMHVTVSSLAWQVIEFY